MPLEQTITDQSRQAELQGLIEQWESSEKTQLESLNNTDGINKQHRDTITNLFAEYNKKPEKTTFDKIQPLLVAGAYILDTKSGNKRVRSNAGVKLTQVLKQRDDEIARVDAKRRQKLQDRVSSANFNLKSLIGQSDSQLKREDIKQKTIGAKIKALKGKELSVGDRKTISDNIEIKRLGSIVDNGGILSSTEQNFYDNWFNITTVSAREKFDTRRKEIYDSLNDRYKLRIKFLEDNGDTEGADALYAQIDAEVKARLKEEFPQSFPEEEDVPDLATDLASGQAPLPIPPRGVQSPLQDIDQIDPFLDRFVASRRGLPALKR